MKNQTQKYTPTGKYRPVPIGVRPKPKNERHPRRSFLNDYKAKGYYLITSVVNPDIEYYPLSAMPPVTAEQLKGGNMILPNFSPLGEMIESEIKSIPKFHPEVKIIRFVIMPDHIHIVLQVVERLKRHLGKELAGFFGACSKHYDHLIGDRHGESLFDPFHDRIIYDHIQLDRAIKYVEDNPRRYILKKLNPHLFRTHLNLRINGRIFSAFGNLFLLRSIYLLPVRVHRKWTKQEFEDYEKICMNEIEKRAIPITPAIHKAEKKNLRRPLK